MILICIGALIISLVGAKPEASDITSPAVEMHAEGHTTGISAAAFLVCANAVRANVQPLARQARRCGVHGQLGRHMPKRFGRRRECAGT